MIFNNLQVFFWNIKKKYNILKVFLEEGPNNDRRLANLDTSQLTQ